MSTNPVDSVYRLLKRGIVSDIHHPSLFRNSRANFLREKQLFGFSYPLVCYILKQLLTSVSVKSGRYLARHFADRQISTTQ